MSKPKGRHVEVRKDRGTARKAGEIINSIARLIRAVAVLVETLRGSSRTTASGTHPGLLPGGSSPLWPLGRPCPQRRWGTHPAGRLPGGVEGWDQLRWISTPTRSTKARCHGTSTARGLYLSRTKATALSGLTPSRTARMARPVPVLPTPPPHPISTRSPAALSHASVRAATASDPELGTQKSRHRTQRESHGAFAGSRAARYTPNSGSGPSGTPARSPRPRTLRPDGNATTPGAVDSHASLNAVLLFSASRGPRRVEEADRCARILAPLGLVTPSTWTG